MRGVGTLLLSLTADPVESTSVHLTFSVLLEAFDGLLSEEGLSDGEPSFKFSSGRDTALHCTDMHPAVSSSSLSGVVSASLALALPPLGLLPCGLLLPFGLK